VWYDPEIPKASAYRASGTGNPELDHEFRRYRGQSYQVLSISDIRKVLAETVGYVLEE